MHTMEVLDIIIKWMRLVCIRSENFGIYFIRIHRNELVKYKIDEFLIIIYNQGSDHMMVIHIDKYEEA